MTRRGMRFDRGQDKQATRKPFPVSPEEAPLFNAICTLMNQRVLLASEGIDMMDYFYDPHEGNHDGQDHQRPILVQARGQRKSTQSQASANLSSSQPTQSRRSGSKSPTDRRSSTTSSPRTVAEEGPTAADE